MKKVVIIGGGTFSDVRCHTSLATRAFGGTAIRLRNLLWGMGYDAELHLTAMADPRNSELVTNEDVSNWLDKQLNRDDIGAIIFNAALADFNGQVGGVLGSEYSPRLKTSEGAQLMLLTPADKLIGRIRQKRKDIFAVGFKTTHGANAIQQSVAGLELLKKNSLNLVLANDLGNGRNLILTPEESAYQLPSRESSLEKLAYMVTHRMTGTFTVSTVVDAPLLPWDDSVPEGLRKVVDHCRAAGAYKPFLGKTAGHFAARLPDERGKLALMTSIRKSNFNELESVGMVKIVAEDDMHVTAYGAKPSVGGQSQRSIFQQLPDANAIVHFHCPPKAGRGVNSAPQWPYQCGSHECGENTAKHLQRVSLGDGHYLYHVFLEKHGPNIVYNSHTTPAQKVIDFIDRTYDLRASTGAFHAA